MSHLRTACFMAVVLVVAGAPYCLADEIARDSFIIDDTGATDAYVTTTASSRIDGQSPTIGSIGFSGSDAWDDIGGGGNSNSTQIRTPGLTHQFLANPFTLSGSQMDGQIYHSGFTEKGQVRDITPAVTVPSTGSLFFGGLIRLDDPLNTTPSADATAGNFAVVALGNSDSAGGTPPSGNAATGGGLGIGFTNSGTDAAPVNDIRLFGAATDTIFSGASLDETYLFSLEMDLDNDLLNVLLWDSDDPFGAPSASVLGIAATIDPADLQALRIAGTDNSDNTSGFPSSDFDFDEFRFGTQFADVVTAPVPEPSSIAMFLLMGAAAAFFGWRLRRARV